MIYDFQILLQMQSRIPRQSEYQIYPYIFKSRISSPLHGPEGILSRMCPVYPFQNLIVKRLDTDTQPIKPQGSPPLQFIPGNIFRVCFDSAFSYAVLCEIHFECRNDIGQFIHTQP